ncbi:MAG TPA: kelch repeat-containing protein [Terracidiphilus sp.]|nr:kelch repeat-containing protein [Terracidiphilus sp.]
MLVVSRALISVLLLCGSGSAAIAQTGQWAWMGGDSIGQPGQVSTVFWPGVYGTLSIAAAGNIPGSRSAVNSWTDRSGNLWLFGGIGRDSTDNVGYLNDLWEYTPATGEWTWMGGSSTLPGYYKGAPGVYGTLGVPAAGNIPGGRKAAISWTDRSGNFWLFGGYGTDSAGVVNGELNDLWEFNPSTDQWAWMAGSSTLGSTESHPGVYGTLGVAAPGNIPGSRDSAATWTDMSGNLWLFGGYGDDVNNLAGYLNDLWEFNPSTLQWTWMAGSTTRYPLGVYGTLGAPSSANTPGGRQNAAAWTDSNGNFWLFGGAGANAPDPNDLWKFNPSALEWTWMSGNQAGSAGVPYGVYGTLDVPAPVNIPGGRDSATTWTDANGNFWLLGGFGYDSTTSGNYDELNDVWQFNPSVQQWTWMGGSSVTRSGLYSCYQVTGGSVCGQPGVYGTLGVPAPGNISGARALAGSWVDSAGNLWLLAGAGSDSESQWGNLNDLWEYSPPTPLSQAATPTFSVAAGTYTTAQTVTITDATSGATIYYTTNGTTPTTNSTVYNGPITVSSSETVEAIASASGNYSSAVAAATYTILQTPIITWPAPAPINYGTALGAAQLDATANVPGTFVYNPAAGTIPAVGTDTLTVSFTPTDTANYTTATASVTLTVIAPSFTLSASPSSYSVAQSGSQTGTISVIGAGGFHGSVALSASGLPSGVKATFGTNPTTGVSSLTLQASNKAATGSFAVTITGTSGSLTANTTIALTVVGHRK